jgi:hypothetical protein
MPFDSSFNRQFEAGAAAAPERDSSAPSDLTAVWEYSIEVEGDAVLELDNQRAFQEAMERGIEDAVSVVPGATLRRISTAGRVIPRESSP